MIDGVYEYQSDTPLDNINVLYCRTAPQVSTIVNRTLGGLWFTQVIGTAAVKADVQLYAKGMDAKDSLLDLYASGSMFTIQYDGYQRTGHITSEPAVELVKKAKDVSMRRFTVQFSFGVDQEVAV